MFKQQKQLKETEDRNRLLKPKEQSLVRNRGNNLGIKLVTNSMEENKPNINNEVYLVNLKQNQNNSRNSSIKGIQVMSSRQSSNQRRQLATSRSHQKQKESRQIKSQTNISEFEDISRNKQSSIEKRDKSLSEMQDLCLLYEGKFKQAMLKNSAVYQLELDSLKEIIGSNEERINNLITTINYLAEKDEKRAKIAKKLQQRLESIAKYHQQCHQYTLRRLQNLQSIYSTLVSQIQSQSLSNRLQFQNRFNFINLIIKDIFTIQRISSKHQLSLACQEISKFHVAINEIDLKINLVNSIKNNVRNVEVKQDALKEHIGQINFNLKQCQKRIKEMPENAEPQFSLEQIQLKFNNQLLMLQNRIKQVQKCHYDLQVLYQNRQEKAQKTICELSGLLHKNQRELEVKTKEGEELSRYNLQIQNKLIQSRLKQNSLKLEVDSYYKILETSKRQQHDLVSKEKEVFKQKFQELFKKNEELQSLNCNNKYLILQKDKQIRSLKQKTDELQKQIEKLSKTNGLVSQKQEHLSRLAVQNKKLKSQLQVLKKQNEQLRDILNQNAKQVNVLENQNRKIGEQSAILKKEIAELIGKCNQITKQFQQQQLYSEHLEHENEELQKNLNQYKKVFQSQSEVFKQTINNLQKENIEIRKTLELQSDKLFATQPKKYESIKTPAPNNLFENKLTNSKLLILIKITKLKNIFQKMKVKMPVICEIDSSGYLKSYETGTYIIDQQQNLFELADLQLQAAVQSKVISLFQ